jgi:hypothetical protein
VGTILAGEDVRITGGSGAFGTKTLGTKTLRTLIA